MQKQERDIAEWSAEKRWNPFNSYKLLAQVYRWRLIRQGQPAPQPGLVTVDPINICNLSCTWCNASHILSRRRNRISSEGLMSIARGLSRWQGRPDWPAGVEAVCIAGGGEPLLHPKVGDFIRACVDQGIEVGVVTNGTLIDRHVEELAMCTWVGVSVDAGSQEVFQALKGKPLFGKVCDNIRGLNDYIAGRKCTLSEDKPGYGVSYKYLLYNGNIEDVSRAVATAKEVGCKNFHLRPAGIAWDKLSSGTKSIFDQGAKERLIEELQAARSFETRDFSVFGITHKFDGTLNQANCFSRCHAIFMTCVFMPPRDDRDEQFCVGLCCDRRGDERLEFSEPMQSFAALERLWGGAEHWKMFESINLKDCPRCTYQPHNQIFEHVIENDSMTYKFI